VTRRRASELVVFLGPSLPAAEARALARCALLPPARQGDVWRALRRRPRAIALVDGRFEQVPSVWHRELLDALDAGVAVFGGASMGALRAAELAPFGMVGVGAIAARYRGGLLDDAEVALLHAGPEHGHLPLTVPLVNVRHAAAVARARGVLDARRARELVGAAARIFYQERTWEGLLAGLAWPEAVRARWERFAAGGLPDLKAEDARATIRAADAWVAARRGRRAVAGRPPAP